MAYYNGLALHVNYNIYGDIVELHHVLENCRLVESDDSGYVGKIAIHPDWSGQKTRGGKVIKVAKENIDYIDVFNPDKRVVAAQIEAAGGIEYYKGQVLWVSLSGKDIYPTGKGDCVVTEMSTDEGLANVKYHGDYIFAFDHINEAEQVVRGLKIWRRHSDKSTKLYVLSGYESQGAEEIAPSLSASVS